MTRYLLLFDSYGLVLWGTLSDERTGLSLIYAAGPRQHSLSLVQDPWDLRPYFTVPVLRRPFSSPPTTRRVAVDVAYRIGDTESNSSFLRCHETDISVVVRAQRLPSRCPTTDCVRCLGEVCLEVVTYAVDSHVTLFMSPNYK
jgi:hypothetical protein